MTHLDGIVLLLMIGVQVFDQDFLRLRIGQVVG
jgi:hypothetical protein